LLTSSAINGGLDATNLGVTAGQATASKALVVDASRNLADATGSNRINNLALSGTFESTGAITATAGITSGGNIVSDTDSTDDLGTTGVRWANLFVDDVTVTNNVTIGGTLTLTGGITLNGNTTIGDSSADTLTVNSTITSNLIFTDNTYDIGASGATRPRNLYLSGNGVVGGTLGVTGATTLSSTLGVTGLITATGGVSGALTGNVTGNVTGDVTGDLTGNVTGNITGNVTGGTISGTTGTFTGALSGTTASFSSTLGVTGATTLSSDVGIGVAAGSALTSTGTTLTIKEDDNTNSANIEMIGGNASGEVAGRIKASYTNNITSSEIRFSLGPNGADNGETMFFTRGPDGFLERFKVGQGTVSVTGDLAVDTDTLFVDASADRVGINTSSPQVDFHVDNASTNGVARISTSNAGSYAQLQLVNQSGNYWYQTIVSDNSYRLYNGSDRLTILSGGDVGLGTESPEIRLSVTDTYNGSALTSNDIPAVQIINEQGSYTADNVLGVLGFGKSQGFASGVRAGMVAHYSGTGSQSSNVGAYLSFRTSADGAGDSTERARIDSSGNLLVGRTGTDYNSETGLVLSGVGQVFYTRNASASNTTFAIYNNRDGAATNYINFMTGGTTRGSISWTSSSTSYNTTSDYRLKENVVGITDGITRIKSLKPSRFNFIAEADRTVDGFVAHEVSDVVPEAISGTKDAVDDEGNPEYQGIDQSKLVPLLTAALQEAITKIETLETKVAALEAA
jgi:hypothetical protein